MTTAVPILSQGTTITYNSAALGGIISFSGFNGVASEIDCTTLASPAKEYKIGLQDFGTFDVEVLRDNDDTGQAAIITALAGQASHSLVVVLSSSTLKTATATAFVKSFDVNASADGVVKAKIAFRITGAVVWS